MPRCEATSKSTGQRCKAGAVRGRTVCSYHGGLSPVAGPTHPSYKHGLYSKALPARLGEIAVLSANDPNLLAMNEAIGAVDARLVQLMEGIDAGMAGKQAWSEMRQIIEALEDYVETNDQPRIRRTFGQAYELLRSQFREASIWDEIYSGFEVRRKLVETETRRREKAMFMLSADQVATVIHQMALIVRKHVSDRATLNRIALELNGLLNKEGPLPDPPITMRIDEVREQDA